MQSCQVERKITTGRSPQKMANNILTAAVATVKLGHLDFEGLLFEDGTYGIGVPQIAALFSYFSDSQSKASQKLKRLMGIGFETHKVKAFKQNNYVLAVSLLDFERVFG